MITKTDSGSRSAPSIGVSLSPASMGRFLVVGQFEILAYNPRDHQADQTYDKYDNAWLGRNARLRLGSHPPEQSDHWFHYEPETSGSYTNTALQVLPLLRTEAEEFWQRNRPAMHPNA